MKTVLYLVLALTFTVSQSTVISLSDATGSTNGELGGNALLQMGVELKNPLLRLLGKTLKRVEQKNEQAFSELKLDNKQEEIISELCRLHPCDDWSEWTNCPSTRWGFGTITRERTCDGNTNFCNSSKDSRVDTESKLCENVCRASYSNTSGFCLMFVDNPVIKSVAESSCQSDGGHVVHINSQLKSDAVHDVLQSHSWTGVIWLNGERKSSSSPWEYTYQSEKAFSYWYSSEPTNGATDLCQVDEKSGTRYMWDRSCTKSYKYVCEIVSYH